MAFGQSLATFMCFVVLHCAIAYGSAPGRRKQRPHADLRTLQKPVQLSTMARPKDLPGMLGCVSLFNVEGSFDQ